MTKKDVIKLVGYILLPIATLVLIFLTSCTPSHYIQSAHGGRAQGTAAYRSIYNHPYKVRDAKWYSNHCIYWPYRPEFHSIKPI
jgi:hypothetical protein